MKKIKKIAACALFTAFVSGTSLAFAAARPSVDGHAVGYGDWGLIEPYYNPANAAIIQLYAGPYGMVDRKNIW